MARANETAHLVGTVEEQVAENGDQITTVYTENESIIAQCEKAGISVK